MRQRRRSLVIGTAATIFFALLGFNAISVSAHARVKESVPAKDATVTTVPTQVLLTFSQETSATQSNGSVVNVSGATVSTAFKVDLNDRTKMTITLQPNLPNGVYTVKYHSLTEDDNGVVDDSFNFTLQAAQQAATAAPSATTPAATTTTGSPASGTAAPTGTTAPTATRAATTPAASAATTTSTTTAPTATRAAASAVASGTGGATLPVTGNPSSTSGAPWLWLIVGAGALTLVAGFLLRRATRRAN